MCSARSPTDLGWMWQQTIFQHHHLREQPQEPDPVHLVSTDLATHTGAQEDSAIYSSIMDSLAASLLDHIRMEHRTKIVQEQMKIMSKALRNGMSSAVAVRTAVASGWPCGQGQNCTFHWSQPGGTKCLRIWWQDLRNSRTTFIAQRPYHALQDPWEDSTQVSCSA